MLSMTSCPGHFFDLLRGKIIRHERNQLLVKSPDRQDHRCSDSDGAEDFKLPRQREAFQQLKRRHHTDSE